MNSTDLNQEEQQLLAQFQKLPKSTPAFINRLAVEIVPPTIFVSVALFTEKNIYFLAAIAVLVIFNVSRLLRQRKIIGLLNSISVKTIGDQSPQN